MEGEAPGSAGVAAKWNFAVRGSGVVWRPPRYRIVTLLGQGGMLRRWDRLREQIKREAA